MARPRCGNDPRAQLTDDDRRAVEDFKAYLADRVALRDRIAAAIWERQNPGRRWADCEYRWRADAEEDATAVLAVLPPPADRATAAEAPAAECSAQNRNYESGPRLCIRAAQHHGDHIDERGFHWSDTVAVYPLADGTFRPGVNRAELRRMADETPAAEAYPPQCRWRVELFDYLAEEWVPGGTRYPERHQAMERCQAMREKAPVWKDGPPVQRRVVRETTTYTVEDADAQQEGVQP